jgi:hypothetical protein
MDKTHTVLVLGAAESDVQVQCIYGESGKRCATSTSATSTFVCNIHVYVQHAGETAAACCASCMSKHTLSVAQEIWHKGSAPSQPSCQGMQETSVNCACDCKPFEGQHHKRQNSY